MIMDHSYAIRLASRKLLVDWTNGNRTSVVVVLLKMNKADGLATALVLGEEMTFSDLSTILSMLSHGNRLRPGRELLSQAKTQKEADDADRR